MTLRSKGHVNRQAGSLWVWMSIQLLQPFYGSLDFVMDYLGEPLLKKHSPTHTYPDHQSSFFLLPPSMAIYGLLTLQFTCLTVILHNLCPSLLYLPLGLASFTSYSIHLFTKSLSSFHNTCPYHRNLLCCSTEIIVSNPSLSLLSLYLELYLLP